MRKLVILFGTFLVAECAKLEEIPPFLTICYDNSPDLNDCMRKNVEDLRPIFEHGYEPIDLPKLNPFQVDEFVVSSKSSGLLLNLKNMNIYNAHNYTLYSVRVLEYGKRYTFDVKFARFFVNGTYEMDGQLLVLPLKGNGLAEGSVDGVRGIFNIELDSIDRGDGGKSAHIKRLNVEISYKTAEVNLHNLFGDKAISDTINSAVNENIDIFASELMPLIEKRFNVVFTELINKMFAHYTVAQLFPGPKTNPK